MFGLLLVTLIVIPFPPADSILTIFTPRIEDEIIDVSEDFRFDNQVQPDVGANSLHGIEIAWAEAPTISEVSEIPSLDIEESERGHLEIYESIELATGPRYNENVIVKGASGVGTTGAEGAIDRITNEILLSLEERKTLVVWLFDQSGSLEQQRAQVHARFDRIYNELGVIEASGNPAFTKHQDKPLLTAVAAFGQDVTLRTEKPTDDIETIKEAVTGIERDDSGIERVFTAVSMVAQQFQKYRIRDPETKKPMRNVMLIVFSDEAGNDQGLLDPTVRICRRYQIPVYVVGVPAPFGRRDTLVKWIDPDPQYSQQPQWGKVSQGPESFMPERVKLHFSGSREETNPIDSGFGPYSLTRLCVETGGIYFAVHPNRKTGERVNRAETVPMSAYLSHFFDPRLMRKYRPEYTSVDEYKRRLGSSKMRSSLVKAAQLSWINSLDAPRLDFPKRDDADFANQLTESQKAAARLEPKINMLYETLKLGESERDAEISPRWQAGFDLALGRVIAVKVRTEAYNAMLAKAKRGMKFSSEQNDTWLLRPSDDISVGSQLQKLAEKSREILTRITQQHVDTPWALIASRELEEPLGWMWKEDYRGVNMPRQGPGGNGNPPPPQNDQARSIARPKPSRAPPAL